MRFGLSRACGLLFGGLLLLVCQQARAEWPEHMPALGPDAAQRVMDLLDPTRADAEVAAGFRVDGVSVTVDSVEISLLNGAKQACHLSMGNPKQGELPQETLGGIHLRWRCDKEVGAAASQQLFSACMNAFRTGDGLANILAGASVVVVAGGRESPLVVTAPKEEPGQMLLYQAMVWLLVLAVLLYLALGALATPRGWWEMAWAGLSGAAALMVPCVGHPLYQGVFWQPGATPWDSAKTEFALWFERHPEAVPDWTIGYEWLVALVLGVLLLMLLSEMVRRGHPDGTIHRWMPATIGLALPLHFLVNGGAWSVVLCLAFACMGASVMRMPPTSEPRRIKLLARFGGTVTGGSRFVLGLAGTVVFLYSFGGAWAGAVGLAVMLGWFGLQWSWPLFRKRVGLEIPLILCLVSGTVLMFWNASSWAPAPEGLSAPNFPDALWEGVPVLLVLPLLVTGGLRLLLHASVLSVATLAFAGAGAVFYALYSQTLGPASFLVALPGGTLLLVVGIATGVGLVPRRPRLWVMLTLLGLGLHHHLFQLFARLGGS